MATYKPIHIRTATYSGGSRTPSVSDFSKFQFGSPSAKTGGGTASTSLVPYSSPSKALAASAPQAQKSDVGVVGRTLATFGDVVANVLEGAVKSLEGIYDFGATAVGAVGGIFSDEFRKAVQKHVQYDFVGEHIGDPLQELTKHSYLNELRIGKYSVGEAAELVAQGVGGMLPSVALALATGGGSLAAQIAGTGSMMAGAAGNATEEAFASGASYGSGAAYGLARGAIEGATEYLGGVTLGGGTSLAGKALAGTALGNAAQKGVGRVAYNFVSEGAEEVLSDLSDPLAKYLTGVDKNVGENYNEVFKGLPETFFVGGSVGTLMGGAQDFMRSKSKGQAERGGAAATRADYSLRNVIEMNENEGSGANAEKYAAAKMSSYQMMSYELQRMSPEHRAKYLESIGVHKLAFNEKDGTLKAKAAESVNAEAVTPTLRALSGNLAHAPIAEGVQISEDAKTAKDTVLKALGSRANVAITDAIEGDNALYNPDEDVIYISNSALDGSDFNNEDIARAVALHEVAHKAEGTRAYLDMVDEVQKILGDENAPADVKALIGDRVQRRKELVKSYWDRNLSREQNRYVVDTELISNMLGDLLGNSYFVERMGKRNSSAWERFVMAMKAADAGKAAGISKESQKYLSGLYKAYVKAVDDARQGVKVSAMVDEEEKEKAPEGGERTSKQKKNQEKNYENGDVYTHGWTEGAHAGRSGTRAGTKNRNNESLSSIQGGRQGGSGSGLSISDSEGRGISPEIFDKIRNTSILDEGGHPIAIYHFTPNMDFEQISKSDDIGFHSGTIEQAVGRSRGSNGRIFRSYYNIKAPLYMRLDIGSWKPQFLALYLKTEGYISENEYAEIKKLTLGDRIQDYNSPSAVRLREILKSHGYDGISYPNGVEADGAAYIAFDKEQIVTTEILKYENGKVLNADDVAKKNSDERKSKKTNAQKVIDLSSDDKLSALVKDVHGSKRYNIIREYILAELAEQPIRLSDGKMAVVDKRDAQHIARNAGSEKAAQISHIKEIVESAKLVAEEVSAKENKFSHFWYYEAHALYEGEPISLYVNVGQARNAPSYHIYDITKKIRDTAHRVNDVGRPVGYALENGISDNSIPQNSEKSTENEKKVSDERSSKKKVYKRADASAVLKRPRITADMSESERYDVLKKRNIRNVPAATNLSKVIAAQEMEATSWEDVNKYIGSDKRMLIQKIASEFGAIGKEYFNRDVQLSFEFSGNNFKESYGKQKRNFIDFARMFSVFDAVVENAIGVEVHKRPNYKFDPTLENMFVLISAYQHDGFIVPIKLEIKQFKDKPNALYVAISLNKIKTTEVSKQGNTETGVTQGSRSVTISIADIFKKINPSDKSFLKYIPDDFLSKEQKTAKREALAEDERKNSVKEKPKNERSSKQKDYLKKDASAVIYHALSKHLRVSDSYSKLLRATAKEAKQKLYDALNNVEGEERNAVAFEIADYLIDNAVIKAFESNPNAKANAEMLAKFDVYLHKIDLDSIKEEIKKHFGKDLTPYGLWSKHKGQESVSIETVKAELSENGIVLNATEPAKIFFELHNAREAASEALESTGYALVKNSLSEEERNTTRQEIAEEILKAYNERGVTSKRVKKLERQAFEYVYERAKKRAEVWKARYYEEIDRNYIANRLLEKVRHLDELKKGAFLNATQSKTFVEKFKGSVFRLSRIRFRGNLNRRGTRKIFAALSEWYSDKENLIVRGTEGVYNESIAAALESIAKNEKPLSESENAIVDGLMARFKTSDIGKLYKSYTVENLDREYDEGVKHLLRELSSEVVFTSEELRAIEAVVDYFTHFVKNYNKVWRAGKYVDAPALAKGYIESLRKRSRSEPSVLRKWFEAYYQSFGDPMALARYMDRYDKHGFFTETLGELRRAALEAAVLEMQIREPLEKFYKEHKHFLGDLRNKNVKAWDGTEIPLAKAISLYMTLHREQAVLGLARSGFAMKLSEDSKEVRFQGFAPMEEIDEKALASAAKEAREALYQQFTDEEKQFIKIAEKIFGEDCKNAKHETDMIRMGFSNTIEGYYFPIARAYISHSIDSNVSFTEEMNRVSSASFNKDTVTGAKGELFINDVDLILDRHVRGVTQYAKLSLVVDEFNVLYSLDIGENANKATSVMTESKNAWRGNEEYFRKLISDVQGIPASKRETVIDDWLSRIRSGCAKFQLGANPKTCLTQLSSLAASSSLLDADSIIRGFSMGAKDVDEYCVLAKLRNTDNAAALAQGLIEKTSSLGDLLMKPIGLVDRFVITRLFAACQVQISKNGGPALESKENKEKAGELLERVIFETQQNSLATEKSQAMRSGNEFTKALTMFSADGMKVFGRVVDGIGECLTVKELLKVEKDPSEIESLKKQLKRANKKARRAVGALLSSAVLMALLARLVNKFLGRDEEGGAEAFVGDMAGNLVGGLPLIRDVATFAFDGYEINNYAYSAMNDMLKGAAGLYNIGAAALSGEWDSRETARTIRKAFYAAGTVLGVPTRNVYNYTYGIINSISGEAGYKVEDLFYKQSYRADLAKAIEKGDDGMVATIAGLMLNEGVGGMTDKALREAMRDLIAAGYDVVPRGVAESVTFEGEVYELKGKQKKAFEATYSQAHAVAAKLVKSKGFASASEAVKAKAVNFVYDLYYDMALHERVGDGSLGKSALFASAIDASTLALAISTAKSFESDKDKNGKVISGSLKKKIYDYVSSLNLKAAQKYMIMGYLGYKNTLGKDQVNAYIQTLKLNTEQKKTLLEESGY